MDFDNLTKRNPLYFFKDHPLLTLSLTALLLSTIGYISEYILLMDFDINIVSYVELDDFLLVAWKNPLSSLSMLLVIGTWVFTVFFFYQKEVSLSNEVEERKADDECRKSFERRGTHIHSLNNSKAALTEATNKLKLNNRNFKRVSK